MSEPRNDDLERAIREAPDDDSVYSVYGDWLAGQDHPRGKLVALCARGLMTEAEAFLDLHPELWEELANYRDMISNVEWKNGFIASAKIKRDRVRTSPKVPDILASLLDGPGRFLRGLTVGLVQQSQNTYQAVIERLVQLGPVLLEAIYFGDFHSEETELNWSSIGDLEPLYSVVPRLRILRLRSHTMNLGTIVLPELRELAIVSGGLDVANARSLASATWPKLERMDVMFGDKSRDRVRSVEPLQPILDGTGLPALRHLALRNTNFHRALGPALIASKILPQLRVLDISLGTFGDREAELFVANRDRLAHLDELIVGANYFSREGLRQLESIGCAIVSKNRTPRVWSCNELGQRAVEDFDPEEYEDDELAEATAEAEANRYAAIYE